MIEQLLTLASGGPMPVPVSPGPMTFIGGNMQRGYLGEVSEAELISATALQTETTFTSGSATSTYANAGWLKFAYKGKILYIAKRTMRNNLTWSQLHALNMVFGRDITIKGYPMSVRLLTGGAIAGLTVPCEWNDLMYTVSDSGPTPNLWASFTNAELSVTGTGAYSWCQETNPDSPTQRIMRGGNATTGITTFFAQQNATPFTAAAWRPCIELK